MGDWRFVIFHTDKSMNLGLINTSCQRPYCSPDFDRQLAEFRERVCWNRCMSNYVKSLGLDCVSLFFNQFYFNTLQTYQKSMAEMNQSAAIKLGLSGSEVSPSCMYIPFKISSPLLAFEPNLLLPLENLLLR
jgi:hypothetical protein